MPPPTLLESLQKAVTELVGAAARHDDGNDHEEEFQARRQQQLRWALGIAGLLVGMVMPRVGILVLVILFLVFRR